MPANNNLNTSKLNTSKLNNSKLGGPAEAAPQKRVSTMDALKEQILLRKMSMNPGLMSKNDQENITNLAKKSMLASKFNNDSVDEEDEFDDDS